MVSFSNSIDMDFSSSMWAKIPSLEVGCDWMAWKKEVGNALAIAGFGDLREGERNAKFEEPAGLSAPEALEKKEEWLDRQDVACYLIIQRCGTEARRMLEKPRTNEAPIKTEVAVYMNFLEKHYHRKECSVYMNTLIDRLYSAFFNTKLDDCEGVEDYGLKLEKSRSDLMALDESLCIPEPMLVARFLNGLRHNPSFGTCVTSFGISKSLVAITNADGDITTPGVTFQETLLAAIDAELRLKLNASTASQPRRAICSVFCHHCRAPGHKTDDCFVKYPEKRRSHKRRRGHGGDA
ncbi:hypothetical protein E4U57_003055 [Claviceps arundinis]|uniref:CCHC-type domain-containing protein n=1 Tax=Claviceps arundinis TaxID=1623583 RepID=A0ABQ7PBD1_9HYPO|nr:hypothetical protein E4U57_003055 [Claviceps arundinis]